MTSKERLLTAIRLGVPDRVPCMPDFSNMIPCKLTGKPFWDIYLHNDPSLYYAYCKAAKYYGIDGWYQAYGAIRFKRNASPVQIKTDIESQTDERITVRTDYILPEGTLTERTIYYRADPPTAIEKRVKDLKRDYPLIKKLHGEIVGFDDSQIEDMRAACGDDGIFTLVVGYPGIQSFHGSFEGGATAAIYAAYDQQEIMDEWALMEHRDILRQTEIMLDAKPDVLLVGGSGTVTLANPELIRRYALPTIKEVTRMAKQAGIPTMLHSCGKSMVLLEMLYHETDLDSVNPLEAPPMGDVDLKEVKRLYGDRMCLMGNLNTTDIMLLGSPDDVKRAAREAIEAAGAGGGFILSTGDQCGRDTPPENLFALVEAAKEYGVYA